VNLQHEVTLSDTVKRRYSSENLILSKHEICSYNMNTVEINSKVQTVKYSIVFADKSAAFVASTDLRVRVETFCF
jgi:hypothetical protein